MNDTDFALLVSKPIGETYRDAKNCSVTWPAHALGLTRAMASLCCDELASHDNGAPLPKGLEEKITELSRRHLINSGIRDELHQLRDVSFP